MTNQALIELARQARDHAYAPYSNYPVGAALICADGQIFTGCNVENSSYGLSMCAERTAIFKAISEGVRNFVRLAVIADSPHPVRPCGACRQVISEFFPADAEVILANLHDAVETTTVIQLLPSPFDRSYL